MWGSADPRRLKILSFPVQDLSSSRGACRVDEGVATLNDALRWCMLSGFSRHNDRVLVHQLARGVGECREGKGDAVHLSLVHILLVLLLQITTAANDRTGRPRLIDSDILS